MRYVRDGTWLYVVERSCGTKTFQYLHTINVQEFITTVGPYRSLAVIRWYVDFITNYANVA